MPASQLIERVADVITPRLLSLPAPIKDKAELVIQRLREPVRIAVVGRVKSGKSTMVNAVLGQQVAPTDVSECTRLVTWFHYGHPQRLEIRLKSGDMRQQPLDTGGRLPTEIGIPPEDVASLHVYLANELLTEMTLIDTPGIGSAHREFSQATEALLAAASTSAAEGADAIVFLMSQAVMQDELEVLETFNGAAGERGSAASAVGVLSRADQLGDGSSDAWSVAVELAGQYAESFRDEVATVVPVAGLLAEASEAATLTEADVSALVELAALPERDFRRLLWSADRFLDTELAIPTEARQRLLERLDLYGINRAVERLHEGTVGALDLRRELGLASGIGSVKSMLTNYFRDSDHILKVRSALRALDLLSYASDDVAVVALRSDVERLRFDPLLQPVAELEAWHEVLRGRVALRADLAEQFRALLTPGSAAAKLGIVTTASREESAAAAMDRMRAWRSFMVSDATPAQAQIARVVLRSLQLVYKDLM